MASHLPTNPRESFGSLARLTAQLWLGILFLASLVAIIEWNVGPLFRRVEENVALGALVLADGTTVKVAGFTGSHYHELYFLRPPTIHPNRRGEERRPDCLGFRSDGCNSVVWLTCHRAGSLSAIGFDGLRTAKLDLGANRSVRSAGVQTVFFRPDGECVVVDPQFDLSTPGPEDLVFTLVWFRMIADPGQPVTLRLYGEQAMDLGSIELTVPRSALASTQVWKPLPLPQTETRGRRSATLNAVVCEAGKNNRVTVRAEVDVAIDGQRFTGSNFRIDEVRDPIGNDGYPRNCDLDHDAAAWKVHISSWFPTGSTLDTGTAWKTPELPIPTTPTEVIPQDAFGDLVEGHAGVRVLYVCGPKCPPPDLSPWYRESESARSQSGTDAFGKPVYAQIVDSSGSPMLKVTGESPFVVLWHTGLGWNGLLQVNEVRDDMSRPIPFQHWSRFGELGLTLCFLNPLPDTKSITMSFETYEEVTFDFLIAPPPNPLK
jgi:hypothetical protein